MCLYENTVKVKQKGEKKLVSAAKNKQKSVKYISTHNTLKLTLHIMARVGISRFGLDSQGSELCLCLLLSTTLNYKYKVMCQKTQNLVYFYTVWNVSIEFCGGCPKVCPGGQDGFSKLLTSSWLQS